MVTGDHTRVGLNPLLSEVPQPISSVGRLAGACCGRPRLILLTLLVPVPIAITAVAGPGALQVMAGAQRPTNHVSKTAHYLF